MGIKTFIEKKDGYIHFILEGDFPGLEILDGFDQIVKASDEYNIKNILLDIRNFQYDLTNMESFSIGEYIAKTYGDKILKIACLRNISKDDNFTEVVAKNRGANFYFFNDEADAINWLKK